MWRSLFHGNKNTLLAFAESTGWCVWHFLYGRVSGQSFALKVYAHIAIKLAPVKSLHSLGYLDFKLLLDQVNLDQVFSKNSRIHENGDSIFKSTHAIKCLGFHKV